MNLALNTDKIFFLFFFFQSVCFWFYIKMFHIKQLTAFSDLYLVILFHRQQSHCQPE